MSVQDLPALNASLNALATVLLTTGWILIKQKRRDAHRLCMLSAFGVSTAFLTSYLIYHFNVGSVPFQKPGAIRVIYLTILFTHIVLAAAIVPMILMSLSRALGARFDKHRRIARWTMPLWLYVSVTGVVIYVMLYRL
jgi:putative membrane protein